MKIFAIDPGTTKSAYVIYDPTVDKCIIEHGIVENNELLNRITFSPYYNAFPAIEMVASYGMPVGATVFETCVWIGRFEQQFNWNKQYKPVNKVYRKDVKMCLCYTTKANDSTIRQALIDIYGSVGTIKNKGRTYGISKDKWAALGVAHTFAQEKLGVYWKVHNSNGGK